MKCFVTISSSLSSTSLQGIIWNVLHLVGIVTTPLIIYVDLLQIEIEGI
jgi:hypothetical protein